LLASKSLWGLLLAVRELHVQGYRSVKEIRLKLKRVNVLVGPNGCGKSNLYRSMMLIAAAARGTFAMDLASEGGIASILWAGGRHKNDKKRLLLEVELKDLTYSIECGKIPLSQRPPELACFENDPDIKREEVSFRSKGRSTTLVKRENALLMARNMDGRPIEYPLAVSGSESVLSGLREPQKFPELSALRQEFLNWRFYHQFRTDIDSPLRQPQVGVLTPVMSNDGLDVAAALATIRGIGNGDALNSAIDDAFPGSRLQIDAEYGQFNIGLHMRGFHPDRPFSALELSDGTLQYLCLLAALLSPRPPALLALNEPETSIHPDLNEPLAKLIVQASKRSQIWITTHSRELANFITKHGGNEAIELEKRRGETMVKGAGLIDREEDDDFERREHAGDDRSGNRESRSKEMDVEDEDEGDEDQDDNDRLKKKDRYSEEDDDDEDEQDDEYDDDD
jgi:predicted ATPase